MVRQWQQLFFDNRESGVDMEGNPDFVKLVRPLELRDFILGEQEMSSKYLKKHWILTMAPVLSRPRWLKLTMCFQ